MFRSPAAGRARLSYRSPVGRTAAAERCPKSACPSLTIDAAGTAGYRREPSARRPPRAARNVPPQPCFPPPPTRAGRGAELLGSSVAVAVGGAHVMHQLLPWGKLVWLFSNSCLHRMHVFVAPSMGCVSSVVVVCACALQPSRAQTARASRDANLDENLHPRYRRSRHISEPPDS